MKPQFARLSVLLFVPILFLTACVSIMKETGSDAFVGTWKIDRDSFLVIEPSGYGWIVRDDEIEGNYYTWTERDEDSIRLKSIYDENKITVSKGETKDTIFIKAESTVVGTKESNHAMMKSEFFDEVLITGERVFYGTWDLEDGSFLVIDPSENAWMIYRGTVDPDYYTWAPDDDELQFTSINGNGDDFTARASESTDRIYLTVNDRTTVVNRKSYQSEMKEDFMNSVLLVYTDCTVSLKADGRTFVDNAKVSARGTRESPPTILNAAVAALDDAGLKYELDYYDMDEPYSILSITDDRGSVYRVGYTDSTNEYLAAWEYTVDGVAPESGRMGTIRVQSGQRIEFSFNVYSVAELVAESP